MGCAGGGEAVLFLHVPLLLESPGSHTSTDLLVLLDGHHIRAASQGCQDHRGAARHLESDN